MNPKLDCEHYKENTINNPNARKTMIEAMEELDILDVFRELHPDRQRYTWRRKNPTKMARLDYFLVSNSLFNSVNDSYVEASYRSDHSMVILSIKLQEFKKGKGLWKFNNSLLHNKEYVELVKKTISNIKQQYAIPQHEANISEHISDKEICFNINDQLFLEVLLMEIRGQSISFSSHLKKSKNNREVELSDIIQELEEQEALADSQELENAKKELEAIRLDKLKGAMIRSKAKWIEEGEKPSSYFCNLEKRNYVNKIIHRIEQDDGHTITCQEEILKGVCDYYEELYKSKNTDGNTREWENDDIFKDVK